MPSDEELLSAYATARAEPAFAEIVSRHGPMVFKTCLRLLREPHEAEDAAQATFVVLARQARKFRGGANLSAWLYGIARRVSGESLRQRARRARHEQEAAMQRFGLEGPSSEAERKEALERLDQALGSLSSAERQVIVLCHLEGRTQEEAARIAGCPQGTIAWRSSRGLERLRLRFARSGAAIGIPALALLLQREAQAAVPPTLLPSIAAAAQGASAFAAAAGATATTGAAATTTAAGSKVFLLAEGVMKAIFWSKVKLAVMVFAAAAAVGMSVPTVVLPAVQGQAKESKAPGNPATPPAAAPAPATPAPGMWIYGMHDVGKQDSELVQMKSLGINTIVQTLPLDERGWKQSYDQVVRHGTQLIPILWDGSKDQTVWDWNAEDKEFELDIKKYPRSTSARFLDFLRKNPDCLSHTAAVYSFHEPFNPENGKAQRTVEQNRKLWQQIHQEEFPNGELKVYGESVTHQAGCENGAVDYEGTGLFSFSTVRGKPMYSTLNYKTRGPSGITTWMNTGIADKDQAIREALAQIDFFLDRALKAPPAPDGSRTKFIYLIQTFAANKKANVFSRVPEAWEMEEWVQQIIKPKKDRIAGMMWYCWGKIASHYQGWLKNDRYDTAGKDRWEAVLNGAKELGVFKPTDGQQQPVPGNGGTE